MWRTIAGVVLLKKGCNGVMGRRTERRKREGWRNEQGRGETGESVGRRGERKREGERKGAECWEKE